MLTHSYIEQGLEHIKSKKEIDFLKAKSFIDNYIKKYTQEELNQLLKSITYEFFLKKLISIIELDQMPLNSSKYNNFKSCNAPSVTLYFDKSGEVYPCCTNRFYSYGNILTSSLKEIVFGKKKRFLQKKLNEKNYNFGCSMCGNHLLNGDIESSHQSEYKNINIKDNFLGIYPQIFEFEISNNCNLMCAMCGGEFSSIIRSKIDKLPPFKFVYNEKFIDELSFFIPYLKACKFLGGEPFLIPFYYKIWDKILEINSGCEIHITTNTTVLTDKVKELLDNNNVKLICSIDSLKKESYEKIRINAKFESVMENLEYMFKLKKVISFSVTPTIYNMYEVPDLISFCQEKNIFIKLNFAHSYLKGAVHDYSKPLFIHQLPNNEIMKYLDFLNNEYNKRNYSKKLKDVFINFINLISKLDTSRIAIK
jgi:radical SAM protein with 4Fe4S-binding SPASM domain